MFSLLFHSVRGNKFPNHVMLEMRLTDTFSHSHNLLLIRLRERKDAGCKSSSCVGKAEMFCSRLSSFFLFCCCCSLYFLISPTLSRKEPSNQTTYLFFFSFSSFSLPKQSKSLSFSFCSKMMSVCIKECHLRWQLSNERREGEGVRTTS